MSKVALITGASKGIGAACALELAKRGYKVGIHYRSNTDEAEAIKKECPDSEIFQYDLAEQGNCESLIKDVKSKLGGIDVLVNNAGMSIDQMIAFAKPQDFDTLISTNLKPVFILSKLASKLMIRKKQGRIINITSVIGHSGNAGQAMYAATKGAVTSFSKSVAADLASFNILCNTVAPGFIQTNMTDQLSDEQKKGIINTIPLGRMGTPKDVAACVSFLASDEAGYITGTTIHVNGGMYRS